MAAHNERYASVGLLILIGSIALTIALGVYFLEPYQYTRGYDELTCHIVSVQLNRTQISCQCKAEVCNVEIPCLVLRVDVLGANVNNTLAFPTYQAYRNVMDKMVDDSNQECSKLYANCDPDYYSGLFSGAQLPNMVPPYWSKGKDINCHYKQGSPVILDIFPVSAVVISLLCSFMGIVIGLCLMTTRIILHTRQYYYSKVQSNPKMHKKQFNA